MISTSLACILRIYIYEIKEPYTPPLVRKILPKSDKVNIVRYRQRSTQKEEEKKKELVESPKTSGLGLPQETIHYSQAHIHKSFRSLRLCLYIGVPYKALLIAPCRCFSSSTTNFRFPFLRFLYNERTSKESLSMKKFAFLVMCLKVVSVISMRTWL